MWKHLENSYNRVLYFNGERDERINEDNRERMWEEASTIERERERACNTFSFSSLCFTPSPTPSFLNSSTGGHVSLFYWVRCCLPIRK